MGRVRFSDACWEWTGRVDQDGYGRTSVGNVDTPVHRVSFEIYKDSIPPGMCVCHRCDNPRCVRPSHLFLATSPENTADRDAKGRQAKGERIAAAKLTEDAIVEIRAALANGERQVDLAARYGVAQSTISLIKLGRLWRHVPWG